MWTTKIGNEAKPLLLGLTQNGALVTYSSLSGPGGTGTPLLRMRLQHAPQSAALEFALSSYADPGDPVTYNAQVRFSEADFATIDPGIYIAEVDAEAGGEDVTFPDDRYIKLRFLASVD